MCTYFVCIYTHTSGSWLILMSRDKSWYVSPYFFFKYKWWLTMYPVQYIHFVSVYIISPLLVDIYNHLWNRVLKYSSSDFSTFIRKVCIYFKNIQGLHLKWAVLEGSWCSCGYQMPVLCLVKCCVSFNDCHKRSPECLVTRFLSLCILKSVCFKTPLVIFMASQV